MRRGGEVRRGAEKRTGGGWRSGREERRRGEKQDEKVEEERAGHGATRPRLIHIGLDRQQAVDFRKLASLRRLEEVTQLVHRYLHATNMRSPTREGGRRGKCTSPRRGRERGGYGINPRGGGGNCMEG